MTLLHRAGGRGAPCRGREPLSNAADTAMSRVRGEASRQDHEQASGAMKVNVLTSVIWPWAVNCLLFWLASTTVVLSCAVCGVVAHGGVQGDHGDVHRAGRGCSSTEVSTETSRRARTHPSASNSRSGTAASSRRPGTEVSMATTDNERVQRAVLDQELPQVPSDVSLDTRPKPAVGLGAAVVERVEHLQIQVHV